MGDLQIDAESLRQVRSKVVSMESLFDRSATRLSELSAKDVGPSVLVSRVRSFGEDWTTAMEGLESFADSLVESLHIAEKTFDDVDDDLFPSGPR